MSGEKTIKIIFSGENQDLKKAAAGGERAVEGFNSKVAKTGAAVSGVVALGVAMASAGAHAIALAAAAGKSVGVIALMPAVLAAAVVGLGAARAVTMGLGAAWTATGQQSAGGGRSAAQAAKAVEAATKGVRDAQQALTAAQTDARQAQEALTRAHKTAADRLASLARSETAARNDQEAAAFAVADAERDLQRARASQNPKAIERADLAYRQALDTLADVKASVSAIADERAEADAKGVEGSDEVTAAIDRQQAAQRSVQSATERLADAMDNLKTAGQGAGGGIDAGAEALAKLSPNGRAAILMLRSVQGGWSAAARNAQQRGFAGAAGDLKDLSGIYLPGVTKWLGRMGGSFNTAIRQAAGLAKTKGFVADVGMFTDNTATATDRLARALRPVVNGIMQFVAIGSGFLPKIAGNTLTLAERFERWAVAARESGKIGQWIGNAIGVIKQLGALALNVAGSVTAIFRAGDDGGSTLTNLVAATAAMNAWLNSASGQAAVNATLDTLRNIIGSIAQALPTLASSGGPVMDTFSVFGVVVGFLADHLEIFAALLPVIVVGLVALKTSQAAANVASVASVPVDIARTIVTARLEKAINAQMAATAANTVAEKAATVAKVGGAAATNAADVAQKRSIGTMIAARVATIAGTVATWASVAASTALAIVTSPITWIILAIVAAIALLVLGFRYAYQNSETFRKIVDGALRAVGVAAKWVWNNALLPLWNGFLWGLNIVIGAVKFWWSVVVAAFKLVVSWGVWVKDRIMLAFYGWQLIFARVSVFVGLLVADVKSRFTAVVTFVKSIPDKIGAGLSTLKDKLLTPFKAAFNAVAGLWNRSLGSITFTVPDWVPVLRGKGWSFPKLPMLAKGGDVRAGRSYIVGDGGEPEVFTPGRSGRVTPASEAGMGVGGDGVIELHIDLGEEIHKVVRIKMSDLNRGTKRRVTAGAR